MTSFKIAFLCARCAHFKSSMPFTLFIINLGVVMVIFGSCSESESINLTLISIFEYRNRIMTCKQLGSRSLAE